MWRIKKVRTMKKIILYLGFVVFLAVFVSAGTVTRSFNHDPTYASGQVVVTLTIDVAAGENFYVIDEVFPSGFTVTNTGGASTLTAGHLKWAVYSGVQDTTLSYTLNVPATTGSYAFSGSYAFQGATATSIIGGDPSLQITSCSASTETCNNADNDCDYLVDEGCDDDNDNYADSTMTCSGSFRDGLGVVRLCSSFGGDCDDNSNARNPGATELCDAIDQNCDGNPYNGFTQETCQAYCESQGYMWSNNGGNLNCCGNNVNEDSPYQATETACTDTRDNDCNGLIDVNDAACITCVDTDGDGRFAISAFCPSGTDCDDTQATVYPGAPEICDGRDNDCAGGVPVNEADSDSDSFRVCQGDCRDTDALTYPGAQEICTSTNFDIDNDCDSLVDEPIFGQPLNTGLRDCTLQCAGDVQTLASIDYWYSTQIGMLDIVQGLEYWYVCP